MRTYKHTVWTLIDDRIGNTNQTLGLANALNFPYIIKNIKYNNWIKLPNFLKYNSLLGIDKQTIDTLKEPFPDIIITAGRRAAVSSLYIKRKNPKTFIIQIMDPKINHQYFDLLIIPEHDSPPLSPNIIISTGAIHNVNQTLLKEQAEKWRTSFQHLRPPFIAVIIGGNSKHGTFTENNIKSLIHNINKIASSLVGSLLITTSRRTPMSLRTKLINSITVPHFIYDFHDNSSNPYHGILALSDIIIVTGDSVSMCSEACYIGKPVYIFAPSNIISKKHYKFIEQLAQHNHANIFTNILLHTHHVHHNTLDEASRIAELIKQRI
ncbi:MAG: mitochondrial fission ELM1 family protein [Rickettsiales endosymbiont of Dermacentor nuttalli]